MRKIQIIITKNVVGNVMHHHRIFCLQDLTHVTQRYETEGASV